MVKLSNGTKFDSKSIDRISSRRERYPNSNYKNMNSETPSQNLGFDDPSSLRYFNPLKDSVQSLRNSPSRRSVSKESRHFIRSGSNFTTQNDTLKLEIQQSEKRSVFSFKKCSNDYINQDKKHYLELFSTLYQYLKENYMIDKKFVEEIVTDYKCWVIANKDYISYAKEEQLNKVNCAQSEIDKKLDDLTKINNKKLNEKIKPPRDTLKPIENKIVADLITGPVNDKKIGENLESQMELQQEQGLLRNKSNVMKKDEINCNIRRLSRNQNNIYKCDLKKANKENIETKIRGYEAEYSNQLDKRSESIFLNSKLDHQRNIISQQKAVVSKKSISLAEINQKIHETEVNKPNIDYKESKILKESLYQEKNIYYQELQAEQDELDKNLIECEVQIKLIDKIEDQNYYKKPKAIKKLK